MLLFPVISLVSAYLYWMLGFHLLKRDREISLDESKATLENTPIPSTSLSVIIPVRNEIKTVGKLLDSLAVQSLTPLEILVVDDHSTDGTDQLCKSMGCRVIQSKEVPQGWNGKSIACHHGATQAKGRLLLFLDADVYLQPQALEALMHQFQGEILTVQPYHKTKRFYESLSLFSNLLVSASAFSTFTNASPPLFGPCILIDKERYFETGGHEAIAKEIVDDVSLGQLAKSKELCIQAFQSQGLISFRMYPHGIGDLMEGWTKNLHLGPSHLNLSFWLCTVFWITGLFNGIISLWIGASSGSLLGQGLYGNLYVLLSLFIYILYAWQIRRLSIGIGKFHFLSWMFFPVYLLFFIFLCGKSILHSKIRKQVFWKNRTLEVS